MFGQNPKRKPIRGDGQTLAVQEIFATVQGEGPHTGVPAVFVRLGGCNLACDFCDTEFESYQETSLADVLAEIAALAEDGRQLVVITGGEPLRQPITLLCQKLVAADYIVQIETNGTLYQDLPEEVEIVCSPKANSRGVFSLRPDLLPRVDAMKVIISATHPHYRDVPQLGQDALDIPVHIQPMDEQDVEKNQHNLERCLQLASAHGYKLSLQTHKLTGLP